MTVRFTMAGVTSFRCLVVVHFTVPERGLFVQIGDRPSAESSNQKIAWTPSRLGDEPFRCAHGTSTKIAMPAAGNTHEVLRRLDLGIQPLAERNRNDSGGEGGFQHQVADWLFGC